MIVSLTDLLKYYNPNEASVQVDIWDDGLGNPLEPLTPVFMDKPYNDATADISIHRIDEISQHYRFRTVATTPFGFVADLITNARIVNVVASPDYPGFFVVAYKVLKSVTPETNGYCVNVITDGPDILLDLTMTECAASPLVTEWVPGSEEDGDIRLRVVKSNNGIWTLGDEFKTAELNTPGYGTATKAKVVFDLTTTDRLVVLEGYDEELLRPFHAGSKLKISAYTVNFEELTLSMSHTPHQFTSNFYWGPPLENHYTDNFIMAQYPLPSMSNSKFLLIASYSPFTGVEGPYFMSIRWFITITETDFIITQQGSLNGAQGMTNQDSFEFLGPPNKFFMAGNSGDIYPLTQPSFVRMAQVTSVQQREAQENGEDAAYGSLLSSTWSVVSNDLVIHAYVEADVLYCQTFTMHAPPVRAYLENRCHQLGDPLATIRCSLIGETFTDRKLKLTKYVGAEGGYSAEVTYLLTYIDDAGNIAGKFIVANKEVTSATITSSWPFNVGSDPFNPANRYLVAGLFNNPFTDWDVTFIAPGIAVITYALENVSAGDNTIRFVEVEVGPTWRRLIGVTASFNSDSATKKDIIPLGGLIEGSFTGEVGTLYYFDYNGKLTKEKTSVLAGTVISSTTLRLRSNI